MPRIVPGIGIPHPAGDPSLEPASEKKLRKELVRKALAAISVMPGESGQH